MRIPCLPERFLTDAFSVLKMMGVSKAFDTPIILRTEKASVKNLSGKQGILTHHLFDHRLHLFRS